MLSESSMRRTKPATLTTKMTTKMTTTTRSRVSLPNGTGPGGDIDAGEHRKVDSFVPGEKRGYCYGATFAGIATNLVEFVETDFVEEGAPPNA